MNIIYAEATLILSSSRRVWPFCRGVQLRVATPRLQEARGSDDPRDSEEEDEVVEEMAPR